jgi:hypothetical protein
MEASMETLLKPHHVAHWLGCEVAYAEWLIERGHIESVGGFVRPDQLNDYIARRKRGWKPPTDERHLSGVPAFELPLFPVGA